MESGKIGFLFSEALTNFIGHHYTKVVETLIPQIDRIKLREAREKAGLSQTQMGARLGVGKTQIGNIENGLSTPSANAAAIWAHACGVSIDELYSDVPEGNVSRKKFSSRIQK